MKHQAQSPPTAFDVLFPDHEDDMQTTTYAVSYPLKTTWVAFSSFH